ncbi:MAG: LysR family transcriptional regulator [Clostridia bacterium]|nr:LysR family transcriptional regulator [Clostridia bacterium]NCC68987.1 LysR family transcriptional regulator [Clostridia bacterium]
MNKNQLDTFIKVAEEGSFSKAAYALYVTPSAVIQQINLLESDLDVRLLIRTNHGIALTKAGEILYEDALKITQQFETAKRRVIMAEEASNKCIRVGADLCRKCRVFHDLWDRFVLSEPYYEAKFFQYNGELDARAFRKKYDIIETLYLSDMWQEGFEFIELFRCSSFCAVPRNHRLAGRKKIYLADLRGEKLAYIVRGIDRALDAVRDKIQQTEPEITLVDIDTFSETVFSMCRLNRYLLQMPACLQDICTDFVAIPCAWECSQPYGFLYAENPPEHVQKFIDFARESSGNYGPEHFFRASVNRDKPFWL